MDFFKTDEGMIHVGRVAVVGYAICLAFCTVGHASGRVVGTFASFALAWWIAFCGKHSPRGWSEYKTSLRLRFGIQLGTAAVITGIVQLLFSK
jgi:hypothetical protein